MNSMMSCLRRSAWLSGAFAVIALQASPPSLSEVVSSGAGGFVVRHVVSVKASPAAAYQRFVDIGSWWDPAHTYSQDGKNLSIKAEAGGCWCETLKDGGSVEHMRVVLAIPGKLLRFEGGLGPLQGMGASGAMTLQFEPADGQTRMTLSYTVAGYATGKDMLEIAPAVDGVLSAQLERFRSAADKT